MVFAEVLKEEVFKNAVNLSRIERRLVNGPIKELLEELLKELRRELRNFNELTEFQQQRVLAQNEFISETLNQEPFTKASDSLKESLTDLAELQALQAANEINLAVRIPLISVASPPTFFATLVDQTLIEGLPLFNQSTKDGSPSWFSRLDEDLQRRVGQEVRKGLALGETQNQIRDRVLGKRDKQGNYRGGILETTKRNAEAITRTAVHSVTNEARKRVYEDNQDVIEGVQSLATLDGRTTLLCRSHDGLRWSLPDYKPQGHNKSYLQPPRHFRCRSVLVPVIVGIEEIDKKAEEMGLELEEVVRASNTGPRRGLVRRSTTSNMEDWFREQSEESQNEMIGKGRADLWREGKADLYQMVNQSGRELSLQELKRRINENSLDKTPR